VSNDHVAGKRLHQELGEIKHMWINGLAPERLAELFHHYQQALTPEIAGKGSESGAAWKEVPQQEKNRLVAAARLALLELESLTDDRSQTRKYFAQPGEAEWGC
jgi:hypothetical protein